MFFLSPSGCARFLLLSRTCIVKVLVLFFAPMVPLARIFSAVFAVQDFAQPAPPFSLPLQKHYRSFPYLNL